MNSEEGRWMKMRRKGQGEGEKHEDEERRTGRRGDGQRGGEKNRERRDGVSSILDGVFADVVFLLSSRENGLI